MTTSASDVAAAIREQLRDRIAYLSDRKLHALTYLAQKNHVTVDDKPLFDDMCTATALGVEVEGINNKPSAALAGGDLAGVRQTAHQYGDLPATSLEAMIRGDAPWQAARNTPDRLIDVELIRSTARVLDDDPDDTGAGVSRSWLAATREARTAGPAAVTPDSPEEIAVFIADVKARM